MRHPVSSTLALLLAAGLAGLPASASEAPAQQSAAAGARTQSSGGNGSAEMQSTTDLDDSGASAAGNTQSSGSQSSGLEQGQTNQAGSVEGFDMAGAASGDTASRPQGAGQAAASAGERHSFSGLVLGVQPVRINADGDAHLLGRVLLDDGRLALVNFGNVQDLVQDQRSASAAGGRANRGPLQSGQRITGTGTLAQQRGEPMLVVEQWRLIGHPASAGRPPMYMHPQVPGGQGMSMNPSRPNRPGPMQHPSWVQQHGQQPGMDQGMTFARGQQQGRPGMAGAPSGSGRAGGGRSMTTDMDVMLTGTVVGVGTQDTGDQEAPDGAQGQAPQGMESGGAPRRIRVSGPEGMEVVADLGSSEVARELSLTHGDQVVLYGEAGMKQGDPVLMTHYAAKLVALPREDDAGGQAPASGRQATQSGADGRPTTVGRWPERGTPKSVITGDES